jgi:hypothetical protein
MNNKTLGTLALIGAPFLALGGCLEEFYKPLNDSRFTGIWGVIYISAWMCSMIALRRMQATGKSRFGRIQLIVILCTLVLANLSNLYQILFPGEKTQLFWALDIFWPFSNLIMLVVGITVAVTGGLPGWRRYVPLAVGLWLPLALLSLQWFGRIPSVLVAGSLYSAVAWTLLALCVLTARQSKPAVPAAFA